jgi:lipoprotein-anchoring transpeptidase ErfK/SrfK
VDSLLIAARTSIARGELVAARNHLTAALQSSRDDAQLAAIRTELARLGEETVLSPRILPDDPLVERYVLQPGDTLSRIAKANKVSVEMLAELNGIADVNRIREGQTIKVIHGPFRAVVTKSAFALDVYLGDTFIKGFPVGLGADDSTPTGQWRVSTKLKNPTYYPPRGGTIIGADDPANPLGERWIGLQGVSGEAEGQQRYGIHGTIEPDSIGKNVSMGCIRLRNEDVEALYNYLVEIHSTVAVSN